MKYRWTILLCAAFLPLSGWSADDDKKAIEKLIVDAYVEGVYVNRDENAVRQGFHSDFVLHVYREGHVVQESLTDWLARLKLDGIQTTRKIQHKIEFIDVTGNSAIARLEIYQDSIHLFTDYFGFYKFDGRWLFINKIFYSHD